MLSSKQHQMAITTVALNRFKEVEKAVSSPFKFAHVMKLSRWLHIFVSPFV